MFSKEKIGQVIDPTSKVVKFQKFAKTTNEIEDWYNSHKLKGTFDGLDLVMKSRVLYKGKPMIINKRIAVYWLTIIALTILIMKLVTM